MNADPRILSVATALPPHRVDQQTAKDFARVVFEGQYKSLDKTNGRSIFENSGIEARNFCVPPEWFYEDHTFAEKNALYVENAIALSEEAARRALDKAGFEPEDVGAVVFVSTTGLSTPSIEAQILPGLGFSQEIDRTAVWGHGCAAGAKGLAQAGKEARLSSGKPALLIGVELCGLTFSFGDNSKAALISTALFGDGAAAAVVGVEGEGPEIVGHHSRTWPDTSNLMGWDIVDSGFRVRLSAEIPRFVRAEAGENLRLAAACTGLAVEDLAHFVIHPGGAKVLDAFEEVLGFERGGLELSREVLRDHGNMSSVTVLFILERFLRAREWTTGQLGVVSALGPGFSAEQVFFKC